MSNSNKRDEEDRVHENSKLKGDWGNILLLTYTYILQCIPRGLAQAVPLILQKRGITYTDQAGFSLFQYPYCFKLLWSPIVDSVYSSKMGRRKTWMIPSQFLIGLMLLLLAMNIDDWLGSEDGLQKPKTQLLTIIFFLCTLFGSTHDIAVDGWALTMLKKRNVGHQSTCNNIGFSLGLFLGYVVFLALNSKEFCNVFRSLPQDHGFIKFADFIGFWSVVCLASTVLIWMFKRDNSLDMIDKNDECRLGLKRSYKLLWQILKLKPIEKIACIMLTHQVAFGPLSVADLKLMDAGLSANTFALLSAPTLPVTILAPFVFSKYLTGYRSMHTFLTMSFSRLILSGLLAICIFASSHVKDHNNNSFPVWYHWTLLFIYNAELLMENAMWVSSGSFFSRVSDPRFGGMYMTLFNVLTHVGVRWPISLALWVVDLLTIRKCDEIDGPASAKTCEVIFDGYFTETIICSFIGIIWLRWARRQIYQLEKLTPSAWIVEPTPRIIKEKVLLAGSRV